MANLRNHLVNLLLVAFATGALIQVLSRVTEAPSAEGGAPWISPPVGERIEVGFMGDGMANPIPLSDLHPGLCRYVVIYSPTCPACRNLVHHWTQDLLSSTDEAVPDGWATFWISGADRQDAAGFFPEDFALPNYTDSEAALREAVALRAVPAHLVLDREGRVVEGGVGAPLLEHRRFAADCTLGTGAAAETAP